MVKFLCDAIGQRELQVTHLFRAFPIIFWILCGFLKADFSVFFYETSD